MKLPCDEAVILSQRAAVPCEAKAGRWILAATILGSSLAFIDSTVVNVALPAIQAGFHATVVGVQWVVESYGLFLAALVLVGGSLGDRYGRRKVFLIGVTVFAIASLSCGLASSIGQLILARSVQGVGAALLVPGSLSIISASFDERSRGQAIGTWSGFTAVTAAIGPVLGGWVVEHGSWRWAFLINPALAAAVIVIALLDVPESRAARYGRIDWLGALLVTAGLGGSVTGFVEAVNLGWGHPLVVVSSAGGCACVLAFLRVERKAVSPMVPLEMFSSAGFSGANLLTLLLYAALGAFLFLFPLNLIQVQGYTATQAGAALLPVIVLMFVLSRWAGGLVARYGARLPLFLGPLLAGLGFLLLAVPSVEGSYWRSFFPGIAVLGLGMTMAAAPVTTVVMDSAGQERAGAASGINNSVARIGGVLAVAVLGIVMVGAFGYQLHHQSARGILSPEVLQFLQAEKTKLAGVQLPAGLPAQAKTAIRRSLESAFVFGFRVVMAICAALALASAAVAWLLIPARVGGSTPSRPQ
jgi:EmrB/QacA subfamily drug resistance transporter